MPHKCSVPGCRTNYDGEDSVNQVKGNKSLSVFKFPKDPQRRAFWLSLIPGISDFTPSQHSRVCSKHFLSKFIFRRYPDNPDKQKPLKLSSDAYPTIFSNAKTDELSLDGVKRLERSVLDDIRNGSKTEIYNWVSTDKVIDFSSFCEEADKYLEFAGDKWIYKLDTEQEIESIRFFLTQDTVGTYTPDEISRKSHDQKPLFTVTVSADMHVKVHNKISGDVPESSMSWIFGKQSPPVLAYWSQFVTIICQCSAGFWIDHYDFNPSICINDLHELPPLEKQEQDIHSSVGDADVDEVRSIHTAEIPDITFNDNGRFRDEIQQLTQNLYSALYQRNFLMKMMKNIQDLASIDLDILSLSLIMNMEGKEEMEKVHRLVETIMNHAEEMNAGLHVMPEWMKENSELTHGGDVFQVKFPSFQVNLPPLDDYEEMNGKYDHSDGDNIDDGQSLVEGQNNENVEVNDAGVDNNEVSMESSGPVNDKEHGEGFTCEICGNERRFALLSALQRHKRAVHDIKLPTQCKVCGKECKTQSRYLLHSTTHSDERPFQCVYCGITFKCRTDLNKHEKTIHSEDRPHICSICGRSFKQRHNLTVHGRMHMVVKTQGRRGQWGKWLAFKRADNLYHCEVCDEGFRNVTSLKWHLAYHSDVHPFQCTTCGKSFKWNACYSKHVKFVHKDERPFGCSLCDKKFKDRSTLKIHQLVHVEQGDFECDICEKKFKTQRSLHKHRSRYKQEKGQYQCSLRLQNFKQKEDLSVHKQDHINDNVT